MVLLVLPLSSIINYDKDRPIQLVYNGDHSDVVMGEEVPKHQTPDGDWRDDDECEQTLRRNLLREYMMDTQNIPSLH
jgi:hypothetical protein